MGERGCIGCVRALSALLLTPSPSAWYLDSSRAAPPRQFQGHSLKPPKLQIGCAAVGGGMSTRMNRMHSAEQSAKAPCRRRDGGVVVDLRRFSLAAARRDACGWLLARCSVNRHSGLAWSVNLAGVMARSCRATQAFYRGTPHQRLDNVPAMRRRTVRASFWASRESQGGTRFHLSFTLSISSRHDELSCRGPTEGMLGRNIAIRDTFGRIRSSTGDYIIASGTTNREDTVLATPSS